ncbi:MAG: hypothetical protein PHI64_12800 [Zoogloea sp.]|uniref:hypothetical protein n=1 Tax=Zoogloea sp. TaxID=49181 RepID=UPI0026217CED|nr:hypothetical protein [Zoogloea sp.]MDD2989827.1 hypothetical protein [Zoogloea sp.]
MIRRPHSSPIRVTKEEIQHPSGLRIPKGHRVRTGDSPGRCRVIGVINLLSPNSPLAHDALHNGVWVDEDQTEELRHA